jgi:serine/threonine protein kinase
MNDSKGTASRVEFHQEFSMLATLHHPNIVTFYGISEDLAQGILYIVEEFCAGGDLASYIVKQTDRLSGEEYCRIGLELLGAVRYMHDKGIAHRDLKVSSLPSSSLMHWVYWCFHFEYCECLMLP